MLPDFLPPIRVLFNRQRRHNWGESVYVISPTLAVPEVDSGLVPLWRPLIEREIGKPVAEWLAEIAPTDEWVIEDLGALFDDGPPEASPPCGVSLRDAAAFFVPSTDGADRKLAAEWSRRNVMKGCRSLGRDPTPGNQCAGLFDVSDVVDRIAPAQRLFGSDRDDFAENLKSRARHPQVKK
ncbi:hypothetical protein U8335_20305 [Roseiconus lacunae]|uniref:hypothetical protein n=1 Tax=Roseiconus lacunae TaxID=2605694 RepID=UPI0030880953|nr:hypothetical protein U8335_20305 [Stieleria sp. HD01]